MNGPHLASNHVADARKVFKAGQVMLVRVLKASQKKRRLLLSFVVCIFTMWTQYSR